MTDEQQFKIENYMAKSFIVVEGKKNSHNFYIIRSGKVKVAKENPVVSKILEAIGLHTGGSWTVAEVVIEDDTSYTNGMYSEISSTYFDDIEGVQRAPFLRNMKTRSDTANNWDLHNGDRLRGRTARIVLKNTSTSEVQLFAVEIIYTDSII